MLNVSTTLFSEAVLDAVRQIGWTASPDGTCTYLNRRWYEFMGQARISDGLPNWLKAVHPHDQRQALAAWRAAATSNEKFENQFKLQSAGGGFRWVLAQAEPEVHESRILSWCGTCTDIHDWVLAEEALKEREEYVRTVLNSIPQAIWSATPSGLPAFFSAEGTKYLAAIPRI